MIKSEIRLDEAKDNSDLTYGTESSYIPARVVATDGTVSIALFTQDQVDVALAAASANLGGETETDFLSFVGFYLWMKN